MSEIENQIIEVIEKVRPYLLRDGGDIAYVGFDEGVVFVRMLGACSNCLSLDDTITLGVEAILVEEVAGVKSVKVIESED